MSDTDDFPFPLEDSEALDLVEADLAELTQFATRHHVALEKLERCQQYLRSCAPFDGSIEMWPLEPDPMSSKAPALVFRHRRGEYVTWLNLPRDFPTMHLLRLIEIVHES